MASTGIKGVVASICDEKIAIPCPLDKLRFFTANGNGCII